MTSNSYGTDERGESSSPSIYLYENNSEVGLHRHIMFQASFCSLGHGTGIEEEFSEYGQPEQTSIRAQRSSAGSLILTLPSI